MTNIQLKKGANVIPILIVNLKGATSETHEPPTREELQARLEPVLAEVLAQKGVVVGAFQTDLVVENVAFGRWPVILPHVVLLVNKLPLEEDV